MSLLRLAQDSSVKVGVIEAGVFHREDDVVSIPGKLENWKLTHSLL
jgi:hypothetical protein